MAAPATTQPTTTTSTVALAVDDGKTSSERRLIEAFTVSDDDLQPKSVVASGDGLFFAQNMMYRHNVSVYDRSGTKVGLVDDRVDLGDFGFDPVTVQGSPVEAAFTPDGRYVYVSNYKMYGDGYNPVADDSCDRGDWDDSFVYKIDVDTLEIVAVVPTGAVPKFLAGLTGRLDAGRLELVRVRRLVHRHRRPTPSWDASMSVDTLGGWRSTATTRWPTSR